jgi:hypothetical protein
MGAGNLLLMAAMALAHAAPSTAAPTEYETALKCRAYAPVYTPVLSRMLSAPQARKFAEYWVTKTEKLGKKMGLAPKQVYGSTLVIELKAEEVDAVLAHCLEVWGASKDNKAPL